MEQTIETVQSVPNTHIGLETETVIIFCVLAFLAFCVDIWAHRSDKPIALKTAVGWTLFWITVSMGFACFLYFHFNAEVASLFLAGYLFEQALSVDNLFVMMAIFAWFKIPDRFCHRVLYWGVLGAVVFRLLFVLIGTSLFALGPAVELVFALVVAFSGVMMLKSGGEEDEENADYSGNFAYKVVRFFFPVFPRLVGHNFFVSREHINEELKKPENKGLVLKRTGPIFATPLFLCLAVIETTDVMFAFDSVPAVIAISREPLIVYSAMIFAVLGLRSMYFVLDALRQYLVHLEKAVIVLLFFIAFKLAAGASLHLFGFGLDIDVYVSLIIIAVILGLGVGASFVFPQKEEPKAEPQADLATAAGVAEPESQTTQEVQEVEATKEANASEETKATEEATANAQVEEVQSSAQVATEETSKVAEPKQNS